MLRSLLYGLSLVVGAYAVVGAATSAWSIPAWVPSLVWLVAAPAAMLTSWVAPRMKFFAGLSMAAMTAIVSVTANLVELAFVSRADEMGPTGHVASAVFVVSYSIVPAALGALAGWLFNGYGRQSTTTRSR